MVYVLLKGHKNKQDLRELFRIFYPNKEIKYIDNLSEYSSEHRLIINTIYKIDGKIYAKTELYLNNELVKESVEDISKIKVYRNSLEKNLRMGIKKTLIDVLRLDEKQVPWGILTGIRPMKIIHDLIDKNIEDEEIIRVMIDEYKLSINRAELILEIGKKQRKYIYPLDKNRYSLYISIPFCPTTCLYCSFPSLPIKKYEKYVKDYIDVLIYEIENIARIMKGKNINTVYVGGGTPTSISRKELERIIRCVYREFGKNNINEFTIEAGRPDTITREYLEMLNENKVDRISINPQTMNNKTLEIIGRNHRAKDIIKTFDMAREIGFKSINMDLIIGLPGEEVEDIKNTLNEIKKLNPENLTIHTLSVKRGSKFRNTLDKYPVENQNMLKKMLDETFKFAKESNLEAYYLYRQKQTLGNFENIGYAKYGKECIYNIVMMEEKETVISAGMGSVSKIFNPRDNKIKRVPNFKGLKDYMIRIDEVNRRKEIEIKR